MKQTALPPTSIGPVGLVGLLTLMAATSLQIIEAWRFPPELRPVLGVPADGGDPFAVLLRAAGSDAGIVLLLTVAGGLLLPRHDALRWARTPLALIVGLAVQATLGLTWLPGGLTPLLAIAVGGAVALHARTTGIPTGWRRRDLRVLVPFGGALLLTAVVGRTRGLVVLSNDSSAYLRGARSLAAGTLRAADLDIKRGIAQQSLHAPGFAVGSEGVLTIGMLLMLAVGVLLMLLPTTMRWPHAASTDGAAGRAPGHVFVIAAAGALLVHSSRWMWFTAHYINAHLLVASLLLALALLWTVSRAHDLPDATVAPAVIVVIGAVVLARAEAALIVGLLLLGTLATDGERGRPGRAPWPWAWRALGAWSVVWNATLAWGLVSRAEAVSVPVAGGLVAGLLVAAVPSVLSALPVERSEQLRRRAPIVTLTLLWTLTLGVLVSELVGVGRFSVFASLRTNLGEGAGGWGVAAPLLLVFAVGAVALSQALPHLAPARTLVLGFVPATLLAKLADGLDSVDATLGPAMFSTLLSGDGRAGWGDSVNRMWTHIALVVILLLVSAVIQQEADAPADAPRTSRTWLALPAFALLALQWWQPQYLGWVGPARVVTVATAVPTGAAFEVPGGRAISQQLPLPDRLLLPDDTRDAQVCATVTMTNPSALQQGSILVEVQLDGWRGTDLILARNTGPTAVKTICAAAPDKVSGGRLSGAVTVTLSADGSGSAGGFGVAVVEPSEAEDEAPAFVSSVELHYDAPSVDPRSSVLRTISSALRAAVRTGPVALLAIWVATSVAARRVGRRRSSLPSRSDGPLTAGPEL